MVRIMYTEPLCLVDKFNKEDLEKLSTEQLLHENYLNGGIPHKHEPDCNYFEACRTC